MPTETEIRDRFWKELKSEMTIMLGLDGVDGGGMKPMTAQIEEGESGPLWIFTAKDTELTEALAGGAKPGHATFTGRKHDLFAIITGSLTLDTDPAVVERLWNPFVAAWFEGGKDDPNLALLRFDPDGAKIWLNATPLGAALDLLLRRDPKKDYLDKVAEVAL